MGVGYSFPHDPDPQDACWGIRCPYCGTDKHEVVQSLIGLQCVMRRRRCFNEHIFITQEELGQLTKFRQAERRIKRKKVRR